MAVLSFPHNGGAYNVLVNVAPRPIAALGASLTIISYIATCVVRYALRLYVLSPPAVILFIHTWMTTPNQLFASNNLCRPPSPPTHTRKTHGSAVSACDYLALVFPHDTLIGAIILLLAFAVRGK